MKELVERMLAERIQNKLHEPWRRRNVRGPEQKWKCTETFKTEQTRIHNTESEKHVLKIMCSSEYLFYPPNTNIL